MANVSQKSRRNRQRAEILELAGIGLRRREIAEILEISERTVQRVTASSEPITLAPPERLKTTRAKSLWLAMMREKERRQDGALARYVEPRIARILALSGNQPPSEPEGRETGTCGDTEAV